jgi:hypothetical protein
MRFGMIDIDDSPLSPREGFLRDGNELCAKQISKTMTACSGWENTKILDDRGGKIRGSGLGRIKVRNVDQL